jgi:hypothetical protein
MEHEGAKLMPAAIKRWRMARIAEESRSSFAALFITMSRFGAFLGLAVVTIIRESIASRDEWAGGQASFY